MWNRVLLTISLLDSSSWQVLYNPPLFTEMHLQQLLLYWIFVFCTLFLIFTSWNFYVSIKLSPLLSRHGLFFFEHLLFYFYQVCIFYTIIYFDDYHYCYYHYHYYYYYYYYYCCYYYYYYHYFHHYCCYYCLHCYLHWSTIVIVTIVIAINISSFLKLLTYIVLFFIILFHIFK